MKNKIIKLKSAKPAYWKMWQVSSNHQGLYHLIGGSAEEAY